jgi:hypothetical protein
VLVAIAVIEKPGAPSLRVLCARVGFLGRQNLEILISSDADARSMP